MGKHNKAGGSFFSKKNPPHGLAPQYTPSDKWLQRQDKLWQKKEKQLKEKPEVFVGFAQWEDDDLFFEQYTPEDLEFIMQNAKHFSPEILILGLSFQSIKSWPEVPSFGPHL